MLLVLHADAVLSTSDALAAMPPDDRRRVRATMTLEGGCDSFVARYRNMPADGELRWLEGPREQIAA